jgi:hypothetical protein
VISTAVPNLQAQSASERKVLRSGLEATRERFHAILDSVPDEQWRQKSPASEWTVAEVFVHLTWALEQLPREVESARHGKGMFNMPKRLSDFLSYWYIRWSARRATRESVRRRYDAAMAASIRTLDGVKESEWSLGADFYGHGFHTIPDLFGVPADHVAEHTAGL